MLTFEQIKEINEGTMMETLGIEYLELKEGYVYARIKDGEILITFSKNRLGSLDMKRNFGSRTMGAKFNVLVDTFKVQQELIHIKYKISTRV